MMVSLYSVFIDPLSYEFMQRALIMSCIVGTVCAVFSCFLVLRGWSLMGDAVSHAVLPGLILAYVINIPLVIGAFIAGLLCSVSIGYLKEHSRVKEDALMGIVFSGMFAFGLVLLTKIESDIHIMHVLFGNILGVSWYMILETTMIAGLALVIILVKYRDFMLYCFDPGQAQVSGLNVQVLHYALLICLSLTIVASLSAAGIILVVAMLIAPGATAFLLTKRFEVMLFVAVTVSLASCFVGVIISFHADAATAPLIVVVESFIFICALLFKSGAGLSRKAAT